MWPEFTARDLAGAIDAYHRRDRRFGEIPEPAPVAATGD
jgi:hypothetical protein